MTTEKQFTEGGAGFSRMRPAPYEKVEAISKEWSQGRVLFWDRARNMGLIQVYDKGTPAEKIEVFSETLEPLGVELKLDDAVEVRWGRGSNNRVIATEIRKPEKT